MTTIWLKKRKIKDLLLCDLSLTDNIIKNSNISQDLYWEQMKSRVIKAIVGDLKSFHPIKVRYLNNDGEFIVNDNGTFDIWQATANEKTVSTLFANNSSHLNANSFTEDAIIFDVVTTILDEINRNLELVKNNDIFEYVLGINSFNVPDEIYGVSFGWRSINIKYINALVLRN